MCNGAWVEIIARLELADERVLMSVLTDRSEGGTSLSDGQLGREP